MSKTKTEATAAPAAPTGGPIPAEVIARALDLVAPHRELFAATKSLSTEWQQGKKRIERLELELDALVVKRHLGEATPEDVARAREQLAEARREHEGLDRASAQLRHRAAALEPDCNRAQDMLIEAVRTVVARNRIEVEELISRQQRALREQLECDFAGVCAVSREPLARVIAKNIPELAAMHAAMTRDAQREAA